MCSYIAQGFCASSAEAAGRGSKLAGGGSLHQMYSLAGMGERATCSKVPLFPLVFAGLAVVVITTMVSLGSETKYMFVLNRPLVGRTDQSLDQLSRSDSRELEASKDEPSVSAWDESAGHDTSESFRTWDTKVGCAAFKSNLLDMQLNSSVRSLQPADLVSCADLKKLHVSVLVTESTWIPDALNGYYTCSCGLTCLWTKSHAVADDPDLHFYESTRPPSERKQGDPLRAYIDMEAARSRSHQEDIFVSYHASAHVQATYAGNALAQNRNHFISPRKRSDVLVYWSSSRCVTERQSIASSFLPLISHHSFGKCLNNVGRRPDRDEDPIFDMYPKCRTDGGTVGWTHHIHCAMSHYMFALAIENTMTESYVTEKLFYALDAGTVPIYFGAANVLDLVPPNSVIQASNFNSTEDLVAYVTEVAQDPVKYADFHAWRRCGELGNYRQTLSVSFDNLPCRICGAVSKLGGKSAVATD